MGKNSKIGWTDHTFNPWWGCVKISDGCRNCYAEGIADRWHKGTWGAKGKRRFFGEKHWKDPIKWNKAARQKKQRARVFCGSMCDVFEDFPGLEFPRNMLFKTIEKTPWLTWMLLTKRPANMHTMTPASWRRKWPENVWALTSVENQKTADERIPILGALPVDIKGLSCEPLLESIYIRNHILPSGISWVIAGGESGPNARHCNVKWIVDIVCQVENANAYYNLDIALFVKQLGSKACSSVLGTDLDLLLKDYKGEDPSEWPGGLGRYRNFPKESGAFAEAPANA